MPSQSPINRAVSRLQDYFDLGNRLEVWIAAGLLCLGTFFKFWNVFLFRFDSDEPQHLHVIWAWTHGLVQYRDVFDNHMPLFHLLCAPILGLLGEHAADLYWMRLLMVPLYFLSLWCVYRLGTIAFSRRIGLWAMLLASGMSAYHLCSTEFRTDNVWTPLWFLCLIVFVANPFVFRSFIVSGLLLGLCFGISMKTPLMLATLVSACGIAIALVGWERLDLTLRQLAIGAAYFAVSMAVLPLLIMGFFAGKGVWSQFQYCVFTHNLEPAAAKTYLNSLWLIGGVPILIYATRKFIRKEINPTVAFRQAFVGLTCGMYFLLLKGVWRRLPREDYLPYFPLVALVCVVLLSKLSEILGEWRSRPRLLLRFPLPAIAACLVMILDLALQIPVTNDAAKEVNRVRDVLVLTNADDLVFDGKGQTVFRKRSVRYVLESLTLDRIERGEIADELDEQSPEDRARVAVISDEIPKKDEKFFEANYLMVGHGVMVVGSRLNAASTADGTVRFHIAIPDRYEIITPDRPAHGLLDGTPVEGGRFLALGEHSFVPAEPGPPLAVLWAQAVDRHFTNFLNAPQLCVSYEKVPITKTGRRTVEIVDPTKKRVGDFVGIFYHRDLSPR